MSNDSNISNSASSSGIVPVRAAKSSSAQPAANAGLDIGGLLNSFKRRWPLALTVGILLGALAAMGVWSALPPAKPSVAAQILFDSSPKQIAFDAGDRENFSDLKATHTQLIKSRSVLASSLHQKIKRDESEFVIGKMPLITSQAAPLDWLENELKVAFKGPEIMEISMIGDRIEERAALLDAVILSYFSEIVDKDENDRQSNLDRLKKAIADFEGKIQTERTNLYALQKGANASESDAIKTRQQIDLLQKNQMVSEQVRTRAELLALKMELESDGSPGVGSLGEREILNELAKNPTLTNLQNQINTYEALLADEKKRAAPGTKPPHWVALEKQIANDRKNLEENRQLFRTELEKRLSEDAKLGARLQKESLRQRIKFLEGYDKSLESSISRLNTSLKEDVTQIIELSKIETRIRDLEGTLGVMTKKKTALEVEQSAPRRIVKLQDAIVRLPNQGSRKMMMSGAAGFALFLLGVAGITFLEFRSQRLESSEQLTQRLGLNIVGQLPLYRNLKSKDKYAPAHRQLLESIDSARTLLLRLVASNSAKVIMIASANSGEGKTSLASQLSTSLARSGRRTLLIDADLRKPALHTVFQQELTPGLSEVLRKEVAVEDAIRPDVVKNLSLLSAGEWDDDALGILGQDGGKEMLDVLREQYDVVLIDSSPVLAVADPLIMAQHADGVLVSAMQAVSRIPIVRLACQRLQAAGAKIIGAVLNGSSVTSNYGYGYGYNYASASRRTPNESTKTEEQ